MSDLAALEAVRTRLPFITPDGDVVSVSNGAIYFNARRLKRVYALDLSIALAVAVNETDNTNHATNREEATHA